MVWGGKLFWGDEEVEFLEDLKGWVLFQFMIDLWKLPKWCHGFLKGRKRKDRKGMKREYKHKNDCIWLFLI